MKVLNIHKRIINQPKAIVALDLATLSKENDAIWPLENWPAMRFKNGIKTGGHGPIRCTMEEYNPSEIIQFRFTKPKGFDGIHKLELKEISNQKTEIKHTIDINTSGKAILSWIFVIRPLHNALIEDAFDKLENRYTANPKSTEWNVWVKFLRKLLK